MLIRDAFHETDDAGIYLKYRTDGGIFNLRRLRAKTKVTQTLIRELLFADDCAIMAHTLEHIQRQEISVRIANRTLDYNCAVQTS